MKSFRCDLDSVLFNVKEEDVEPQAEKSILRLRLIRVL